MKSITTYITEKMIYTKVTASKIKYFPESTEELRSINNIYWKRYRKLECF